ncbi:hypothetical protein RF679_00355 [Undibacterium cyanobacteriorum]|uniref:TonB-dependent receptor n=1 Tax=Undibacterium cyanobacteriorum TaxID=3073561 RepID=A0ABY9RJA5_9BURK|nr:hypothetical protein [Undibacterium sp. 20NA77.5]WMW80745.1 hypothetical protein RF679_00355 [Undibacterium sp. 20NA77.5]
MDRKFLVAALLYAVAGMCYGIYMAASKDHSLHPAHAHILLLGFVTSFIYGVIHKLWLGVTAGKLATVQFALHNVGTVVMGVALTLLLAQKLPEETLGPILGLSSVLVLISAVLMLVMCLKSAKSST